MIRRGEFVDNVTNLFKENHIHSHNASTIDTELIIAQRDILVFKNELLLNGPSMMNIDSNNKDTKPLLYRLNESKWWLASNLLFSNIFHYDYANQCNNEFIKKYLNCPNTVTKASFYGIDLNILKRDNTSNKNSASNIISKFLKSSHFNEITNEYIIYECVVNNYYDYLKLLLKYRSNDSGIINGINICNAKETDGFSPLMKLVLSGHCDAGWLQLLLSFKNVNVNIQCQNEQYNGKTVENMTNESEFRSILKQKS